MKHLYEFRQFSLLISEQEIPKPEMSTLTDEEFMNMTATDITLLAREKKEKELRNWALKFLEMSIRYYNAPNGKEAERKFSNYAKSIIDEVDSNLLPGIPRIIENGSDPSEFNFDEFKSSMHPLDSEGRSETLVYPCTFDQIKKNAKNWMEAVIRSTDRDIERGKEYLKRIGESSPYTQRAKENISYLEKKKKSDKLKYEKILEKMDEIGWESIDSYLFLNHKVLKRDDKIIDEYTKYFTELAKSESK